MFNGTQPPSSATTRLPHVGWCSSWDLLIGKSSSVLSLVGNFGEWMDVGMCLRVWINTRIGVEAEFRVPRTGKSLLRQEKEHCPDLELCYCDGGSQVRHFNWFVWRSCWKADARSAPMGLWSRSVVGTGIIFFYKLLRKSCYTVLSVKLTCSIIVVFTEPPPENIHYGNRWVYWWVLLTGLLPFVVNDSGHYNFM